MLVIGIAGGSGSGKTTVVKKIIRALPNSSVSIISQDSYYKDNGHLSSEDRKKINFDHPASIEFDLLIEQIDQLRMGEVIQMPIYSYVSCARSSDTIAVKPTKVVIVEGILVLTNAELRQRMDIKIYVDADGDDRLMRIIQRDIEERGRTFIEVLKHYETFVKPMHLQFIDPTKRFADIIIPQGGANQVAIDIVASRIRMNLNN
ncbi:MAG: uridine kinase [Bacteroidales bacterium]|nr:uridine kinase [Bacteroidales bacterium]